MTVIHPLGRCAYDAYCKSAGGRSLATGDPLPHWTRLPDDIQAAWENAAAAVKAEVYFRAERRQERGLPPERP